MAARHYGLAAVARELPSYDDQNFHLRDDAGAEFVLKIANSDEDPRFLEAQVSILDALRAAPGRLDTPRVVRSSKGQAVVLEGAHHCWLVTFLPGRLLADVQEPDADLLHGLGFALADLDRRLAGFDHPAVRRAYRWDLRRAGEALPLTERISDRAGREAVRKALRRFDSAIVPGLDRLPFQVVHGDANDHNVLVREEGAALRAGGLLDFGDMVWTARACEPAIAMTYAMLRSGDPVTAGATLLTGYHECLPLDLAEIRAIPYLIQARVSVSVTMSAYRGRLDPANEYLSVSEESAWRLFDRMASSPLDGWTRAFVEACAGRRPIDPNPSYERAAHEV